MNEIALLKPKLTTLKLSGMLEILDYQLGQAQNEKWSYSTFLLNLIHAEIERREQKILGKRIIKSDLVPEKTLETFDFTFNPKIHEPNIRQLATCQFMERKESIFLLGPSGVGKSHIAQALGHEVCRRGYDVHFRRMNPLLEWIRAGRGDGTHKRRLSSIVKVDLLIIDDFGLKKVTEEEQSDLYEIICERYEKKPTIITSNRDFNEWPSVFSSPILASAAMDRLVHRALKIIIEGKSYRQESFSKLQNEKGLVK